MVVVPKTALAKWSRFVDEGVAGKAAELGRGHRSFADARSASAARAPRPGRWRTACAHRSPSGLVLIGDAAGFLNPFTGQGVFLALTSAEAASRAIVASADDISLETAAFARYAAERSARILPRASGWSAAVGPG